MSVVATAEAGAVDEALERLHATADEYGGGLSNHGPMVVEALARLGAPDAIAGWCRRYEGRLVDEDGPPLSPVAGDWRQVVTREATRLLPGAASAAGHGVIRVAHAVRLLESADTRPRRMELARALRYWKTTYSVLPIGMALRADTIDEAAAQIMGRGRAPFRAGLISDRLAGFGPVPMYVASIDAVIDVAARALLGSSRGATIALVHAVTTPEALRVLAPYAGEAGAAQQAWAVAAGLLACYGDALDVAATEPGDWPEAVAVAVESGDEHAIKLAAACLGRDAERPPSVAAAVTAAVARRLG